MPNRQQPSIALAKPPKQAQLKPRFLKSLADKALDSQPFNGVKALGENLLIAGEADHLLIVWIHGIGRDRITAANPIGQGSMLRDPTCLPTRTGLESQSNGV